MSKYYKLRDIFSFSERDLYFYLLHEMNLSRKFKQSFNYIISRLPIHKLKPLIELKWDEGKNYHWSIIEHDNIILIFRQYGYHFTIFFKNLNSSDYLGKYGCFFFDNNQNSDVDYFTELDKLLPSLIQLLKDGDIQSLWNNYSFPRPDYIEFKNIWNGGDDLSSIDNFVFCCDELFDKYLELFAETDMLDKIKTIKVGDMISTYKVENVITESKDGYYHGVGLKWHNTNFPESGNIWNDVYSLTRYYINYLFPDL